MKNTIHNKEAKAFRSAQWCGVIGLILLMAVVTPIYEHGGTAGMVIGSLLAGALSVFTFMSSIKWKPSNPNTISRPSARYSHL